MNQEILGQLARNTGLLPKETAATILAGTTPPLKTIVMELLIASMDAHAVVLGDPQSSWNEKRLARMTLAAAFLSAMAGGRRRGGKAVRSSNCHTPGL